MTVETELVDLLQANTTVMAAVGDRIWPVSVRLQGTFPAITYGRNSGRREYALNGNLVQLSATVIVRCWAKEYHDARVLADACAVALDRKTTTVIGIVMVSDGADVWLEGLDVFGCTLQVELEQYP